MQLISVKPDTIEGEGLSAAKGMCACTPAPVCHRLDGPEGLLLLWLPACDCKGNRQGFNVLIGHLLKHPGVHYAACKPGFKESVRSERHYSS